MAQFLSNVSKVQLCRQFDEFEPNPQYIVRNFFSDASLNKKLGFGAVFQDRWVVGQWPARFVKAHKPSIEFLELYALTMALTVWKESTDLTN